MMRKQLYEECYEKLSDWGTNVINQARDIIQKEPLFYTEKDVEEWYKHMSKFYFQKKEQDFVDRIKDYMDKNITKDTNSKMRAKIITSSGGGKVVIETNGHTIIITETEDGDLNVKKEEGNKEMMLYNLKVNSFNITFVE